MEQIIKQCVGIDIAKKDFEVTFSVCDVYREINYLSSRKFTNNYNGFKAFNKWVGKLEKKTIPLQFVMEATGVYHEHLAHFLYDLNLDVSVVLPKRAKDFSKTLKVKKTTDKIASRYLSVMGLEKKLDLWVKPPEIYANLKQLGREKEQVQSRIVQLKNQLHAESSGVWPSKSTIRRMKQTLKLMQKQKQEIIKEIRQVIDSNKELKEKVEKVTTIPGVGMVTAAAVIGETHGFNQIRNKRQLVSYAGYDVINQESGSSINTKPRISKRGNKNIRKAMHMPALSSIRAGGSNKALFVRLVSRSGIKMKGVVAVQRKLLIMIYTLWKNDSVFDPEYEIKKGGNIKSPLELDLVRSIES